MSSEDKEFTFTDSDGNRNLLTVEGVQVTSKNNVLLWEQSFNDIEAFLFNRVLVLEERIKEMRLRNVSISEND
jgi:hypothetical protein